MEDKKVLLREGVELNGQFIIEMAIPKGQGGNALVYLARSKLANVRYAIKELFPGQYVERNGNNVRLKSPELASAFESAKALFSREVEILDRLKEHPNIVKPGPIFEENGTRYLPLYYIEGHDLNEFITSGNKIAEQHLVEIMFPLLDAVRFMHENHIVHCDIKAKNIRIRKADGYPMLIDFGEAKRYREGSVKDFGGTAGYQSAEYKNKSVAEDQWPQVDVYSLGATFWKVVCSKALIPSNQRVDTLRQGGADPVKPAAELAAGHYDSRLLALIDKAYHPFVEERYASVAEMLDDLAEIYDPPVADAEAVKPSVGGLSKAVIGIAGSLLVGLAVLLLTNSDEPVIVQPPAPTSPSAPTAPVIQLGQLWINTKPSGASVELPGSGLEYTPGVELEYGTYQVKVTAPGYFSTQRAVRVRKKTEKVEFILKKRPSYKAGQEINCKEIVCSTVVVVPTGTFKKGGVKVTKPFAIGKHEVTVAQYDAYTDANGLPRIKDQHGAGNMPVVNVSWRDAVDYTQWLSRETGSVYRLPSEAEWEYAATANSGFSGYHWGEQMVDGRAHCDDCGSVYSTDKPVNIGLFPQNGFGLYDMLGNVSEWVADCFETGSVVPPKTLAPRQACRNSAIKVIKGGAFSDGADFLRLDSRYRGNATSISDRDGFRVLLELQ